jgi:Flp pilus assembly protein TadD
MRTTTPLTVVLLLTLLTLLAVMLPLGCQSWRAARHYDRGSDALDRGQPLEAIAELESARRLEPGRSEIVNHLGLAYQFAGRPDDALAAFDRAVELDCTNQAARHNLTVAESRRDNSGARRAPPSHRMHERLGRESLEAK